MLHIFNNKIIFDFLLEFCSFYFVDLEFLKLILHSKFFEKSDEKIELALIIIIITVL